MSLYRLIYEKTCHFPMELEQNACWAIKQFNLDMDKPGSKRKLQMNELEKLCKEAYVNSKSYKQRTTVFQDSHILKKNFHLGQKVVHYKSRLRLFPGKLNS